jgi:hypothetical protein
MLQVRLAPIANLPPGLLIPVPNHLFIRIFASDVIHIGGEFVTGINGIGSKFATGVRQHQWQTKATKSDCLHLQVNMKKKMYLQYSACEPYRYYAEVFKQNIRTDKIIPDPDATQPKNSGSDSGSSTMYVCRVHKKPLKFKCASHRVMLSR